MPKVVHFEIGVDDPGRAIKFYTDVFGWKIDKWGGEQGPMPYWLIEAGPESEPGINGALAPRGNYDAPTVNTVSVPSVDAFTTKIVKAGGKLVAPKMPIPGIGYFAIFKDTEGNTFGIMESDPTAKAPDTPMK